MTQAEFLEWENAQEFKHEYVDGYIMPLHGDGAQGFAGVTKSHARLTQELAMIIAPKVKPCHTYVVDLKLELARSTRYPDLMVTCDPRDGGDPDSYVIRHPKLIIEILSESTAREDLGPKMREYHDIDALEEYVTIDSRKRWARISCRTPGGWNLLEPQSDGLLDLRSIGLTIDLAALYSEVGIQ